MNLGSKHMNNILFVIVCYKEKYWETKTFSDLLHSYNVGKTTSPLSIFIIDNTDFEGWNIDGKPVDLSNIKIDYINLKNPGISVAYNNAFEYAVKNFFQWIVFLDQDTTLPSETFQVYKHTALINNIDLPIKVPLIYYSEGKLLSPSKYINYKYRALSINKNVPKINLKKVSCINTGLMIYTDFFLKNDKYDETLRLDFCDHDFIERSKRHIKEINVFFKLLSKT